MISGEDESSSVINGRLRPRKSTANIPNPHNKSTHKPENKVAQDRPKRNCIPSKALPNKQDDLTAKADSIPLAQLLCPYCDKKFTNKLAASKHSRRVHLSTAKQDNFINCLFCNHSEAVSSIIIRHMVDSHPNQYFACLDCNTRFFSTSELAEHKLNVCEKQKQAYRSKLRQKTSSSVSKKEQKKINTENKIQYAGENKELKIESEFNGLVISCELKSSNVHDAVDIEDNITTNLILPSNLGNTVLEKNALMILEDIQWNRRIPSNFSFRNVDADQILSRLGVVHRSPRVGESTRREWLKMMDASSQKFEKCFDTNFYSRVASNVKQNLARFLDGSFNFSPDPDKVIKTRKSKNSAIINTAEGFPILLPHEQYSRNRFDGYMPRAIAPKHKWKWDSTENEKHIIIDASAMKRDNHVDNCIITLVSSLDIWTQLRMRHKFEDMFCKAATEKFEKQNIIGKELKEILESREIPSSSSQVVEYSHTSSADAAIVAVDGVSDFPSFLGLTARSGRSECPVQPAVLSGEWVRPRCYVCCACGDQTSDSRALTAHMAAHHPNAQVQHYEIVGESLLNADILKHLYVPPSQISNRTRPLRGFRDCTKCKKSITIEDLHQHMLDCAGDTPTVRRKCRSRPFGVRRRRPRLPDNSIRKKVRKDLRTRNNQKVLLRTRPRIRTEVGDAETIRKMIADLPAKRHRQAAGNLNTQQVLRPRRKLDKQRNKLKIKRLASKNTKTRKIETKNYINDSSIIDEDDQPLKPKTKIEPVKTVSAKKRSSNRVLVSKTKKVSSADEEASTINEHQQDALYDDVNALQVQRMSNEANSSRKLDINAKDNVTRGEKSCDGDDNYNNDDDRQISPNEEQDKDNHKSSAPTLLKHSINSITASSNKSSQSLQQNFLPQQANEADTLRDTRNTFLENEGGPSLPEKPHLQLNVKRSSQKKRESLLNCIEKIKAKTTEQKGETMYDHRHAYLTREGSIAMEYPNVNLMDPTTASATFGPVNNMPSGFVAPPMIASSGPYQSQESIIGHGWIPDIELLRKANEIRMLTPLAEPFYGHKQPPETEFSDPRATVPAEQRPDSSSSHLSMAHNEKAAHLHMADMYFLNQLKFGSLPYTSMAQAHLQQQIQQSQRLPFPGMYPQQHHLNEAFKIAQYKNQRLLALEKYKPPDLHYEGRRGYIPPPRNESTNFLQQNLNSLSKSLSSQLSIREGMQTQQMNNLTVPNIMVPSMAASDLEIPSTQRTLQKTVSDSSRTGYAYDNSRNMMDANMLNYGNSRRMSSDNTANTYHPPAGQGSGEPFEGYHALARFRAQTDVSGDKNADFMTLMQDRYGNKVKKSDENKSGLSDSKFKGAEHYRTAQSHTTPVNDQLYTPRVGEEKHPSTLCVENKIKESYLLNRNYMISRDIHLSNMKQSQPNHMPENVTIANIQAAKKTPPRKELSAPNLVGRYRHDQIDDFGSNDEPLDLSARHVPAICNNNTPNGCIENDHIQGNMNTRNAIEVHSNVNDDEQMTVEIESIEDNASNSSIQDNSASIDENRFNVGSGYIETSSSSQNEYRHVPNTFPRQISDERENYNENYHNESQIVSNVNDIEKSKLDSQTSGVSASPNDNYYFTGNITPFNQISDGRENDNKNYHNESLIVSNVNDREKSKLDSQTSGVSASPNDNNYFTVNITPFNRLSEKSTTILESQSLLQTTEAIAVNRIQSINSSYLDTEGARNANHSSSINNEPNTSFCGIYNEQNNAQRDLHSAELTCVQNQMPIEEKTSVDHSNVNNNTNEKTPSDDKYPVKKLAILCEDLIVLLDKFNDKIHESLISSFSECTPPNNEGLKLIITVQESQNVSQRKDAAKINTMPICGTSSNTENRLTINAAALPSSSILPKKRHSPSARFTTQDSNMTLLKPSPVLKQSTSIMSSIPNKTNVENAIEYAADSSTGIMKKIPENECEVNPRHGKIIDVTADDFGLPKPTSQSPNSNIMHIQESLGIVQSSQKYSSEKTASLRAVRIKTPLLRKSISVTKPLIINKEVNSRQINLLDSKQIDLNTAQISYPECGYTKIAIDSAVVQNPEYPEYHGKNIINQVEKRTTQSVARIGSEASNYMSTVDCDLIEQSEMGAATSNFVAKKDDIGDKKIYSIMQHAPSINQMEQKNVALPDMGNKFDEETAQEFTKNNTISESKSSTSRHTSFKTPNPLTALSSDNDTVVPDSANLIYPEQSRSDVANTLLVSGKNINQMNPQDDDINQNLKSNKNSVAMIPLEPKILQNNESKGITSTNFSEDEDSDDDVLLAYIVKQKPQGQTDSSRNEASTSAVVENNRPLRPDPEVTKKDKSISKITKKSTILHPTNYQLLTINNKLNYTVCIEPTVESKIDDANKNDACQENHEIHGLEHRNEDNVRVSLDNTLVENIDLPPVLDVPDEENYNIIPTMISNDNTEVDSLHNLLKKKSLNGDIESNLISKISDSDIETTAQNIDTEPQLKYSELHSNVSQEESSSQYFKPAQENDSLTDESNSLIEIQSTQTELESLSSCAEAVSTIKQRSNEVKTSKPAEFILAESRMSTDLNDTSERDLRRSRRVRSICLNKTDSSDHNINNTVEDNQTANQKIPVPKKQLIFSKFLLDRNTHAKNESGVISDPTAETKVLPAKLKKSPGKTKSKKNQLSDMIYGGKSSAKLNCNSDNNKNITAKEPPCHNASSETLNRSLDTGAIENERTFEFIDDESTDDVLAGKQKSNSLTKNVRQKINIKNDDTFIQQDPIIHAPRMNADSEMIDTGRTKSRLESRKVKSNERRIENPVAGISGYSDFKKQPEKTNTCVEIRTACYNRPIVSKQIGFTMSVENPKNYDPYDIDLDIDMAETSRPLKQKSKKSVLRSSKISKKDLTYENHTDKIIHKTGIEKPEIAVPGTSPPILSDSDSSISDVPLQKYVEEKEKLKIEELKSANCNEPKNNSEPTSLIDASEENKTKTFELASQNLNKNIIIDNTEHDVESDVGITHNTILPPTNSRDETDDVEPWRNDETAGIKINQSADQIENTANTSIVKSNNKQKNKRVSTTMKKSKKIEKIGEQPSDEKCPENIGFYSGRQQRKSNLLAAKKISETFNMMASYDAEFRPRGRPRNSSHNDNRRITDADHTSRAATQDATNATSFSTPHIKELHADPSSAVDEPIQANDDGEVDLITAEIMLNSEEIRKLERDLYSGFKEAAQANAGRTSGFNQLRAEEVNPRQINNQDISTPTVVEVEIETIQSPGRPESPERFESPDRSESPDRPDSPESLKDKPLMYPEEQVNIFEDKYDIIKRRREASAIAKQIQKVDEPKKSKPEKSKKKPERKSFKKPTKKPTYRVSQVLKVSKVSQVPTKAALKVFDGIKISILTQDLKLPPNVSPPNHQQLTQIKILNDKLKKRKIPSVRANSSSSYKKDTKTKIASASDIYEFQDDERPVTKGYRLSRVIDESKSSSRENEEKPVKENRITKHKKYTKPTEESNLRDQENEKSKTKEWKDKGKEKYDKAVNKKITPHEKDRVNKKEKQREEMDLKIAKVTDESQTEERVYYREKLYVTPLTDDYRLSNDYSDTLGNIQDNDEPFNDSEPEDQTVMPGTSGFVPDRNDESSYDSDSSSPTPLLSVLSPYACTCLSEIDSDDSETERGCAQPSCRYSHLNAAKIAVMGKIFKNNAVRCDKSDDTPDEPPKPKPDLDRLFDSLLEPTTDSNEIDNKSPVAGSVSATYFFTNNVKVPLEALQPKKPLYDKDVSTVDDGFSSSNHRDSSEKHANKKTECVLQASLNDTNLLKINDDSTNNFDETTTAPVDSLYIMDSQKKTKRVSTAVRLPAAESSDEPTEEKTPEPSNTNLNDKTTEDLLDNLEKVSDSSDKFKYNYSDVRKTRSSQKKRVAPKADVETSSSEDELSAANLARSNRRSIKKTHLKHKKAIEEDETDKLSDYKDTSTPKRTRKPRKTVDENETESGKKQLSPSRKSDDQNQTDIVPAEETGGTMQRERRKCTVGKQKVLTEDWSSESESEPNRSKGKKKIARNTKSKRSHEADDDRDEEAGTKPPAPKKRARAVPAACKDTDVERVTEKKYEQHGWIVGDSHKKLVTMLVCSKSKSRPGQELDNYDDDEDEKKAIEEDKDEEEEKMEEEE